MSLIDIKLSCPVHDSFRVRQVAGMFDLPWQPTLGERFSVEVPDASEPWHVGIIVGPSGSGKSSLARVAFASSLYQGSDWPADRAVIDCFGERPIRLITQTLGAVGFSSPPAWVKPYAVLSNGERFRCELARALLADGKADAINQPPLVVFDEFTSVVDRTVARVGSAAVARAIRGGKINRRFVAVTCHYDIVPWLSPDWVIDMADQSLSRERPERPMIQLVVRRADRTMWKHFARHHYLSGSLHPSARCFVGWVENRPAAFTAILPFPHPIRPGWREHRTVCLPDYQGVGIGSSLCEFVASLFVTTGKPFFSTSGHPAVIRHRAASPLWQMRRKPGLVGRLAQAEQGRPAWPIR